MAPLYEFVCPSKHRFEKLYPPARGGISVEALLSELDHKKVECPKCHKKARRVLSVTGDPQFVGKGFYATDYPKAKK